MDMSAVEYFEGLAVPKLKIRSPLLIRLNYAFFPVTKWVSTNNLPIAVTIA